MFGVKIFAPTSCVWESDIAVTGTNFTGVLSKSTHTHPIKISILMGFAKPAMPQGTSHDCCCCCCCWWWWRWWWWFLESLSLLLLLLLVVVVVVVLAKAISLPKKGCPIKKKRGSPFSHPEAPKSNQNTVIWSVFGSYQEQNNAIYDVFLPWGAPKSSQNIGIYNVFETPKKAHVAKTALFATLWQDHMSEMLYFTVFLNRLLKTLVFTVFFRKHMHKTRRIAIQRLHLPWQQATKSKNADIYSVSAQ